MEWTPERLKQAELDRQEKLVAGEWVEHLLACGHTVTYDVKYDNPRVGDWRICFQCHRHYEVIL